jgi:hypothetical protein
MKPNFAEAARALIVEGPSDSASAAQMAERAERACGALAKHLARLLGDTGVQMLLRRSLVQASTQFPWLVTSPHAAGLSSMRTTMEQQTPQMTADAFVAVMSAFVVLLERLIGEGLVDQLLVEVWPAVFTHTERDVP